MGVESSVELVHELDGRSTGRTLRAVLDDVQLAETLQHARYLLARHRGLNTSVCPRPSRMIAGHKCPGESQLPLHGKCLAAVRDTKPQAAGCLLLRTCFMT